MNEKTLIKRMADSVEGVPSTAEVLEVRQYSVNEIGQRVKHFLSKIAEVYKLPFERGDWVVQQDQTLIRLPLGARATFYHTSGAMRLFTGLGPMESLFREVKGREELLRQVEEAAKQLNIGQWTGKNEFLRFERLWQVKASAASRDGKALEPVLCRAVGAYRHFVGELPVWGPASVAIKLAGQGTLDSLTVQVRETTGEVIDRVPILHPEFAARQIFLQLSSKMGKSKIPISEVAVPRSLRFGYLSFTKRKSQRLLAPAYVAEISIEGQAESQAYLFATAATEKTYLPLGLDANDELPMLRRRAELAT